MRKWEMPTPLQTAWGLAANLPLTSVFLRREEFNSPLSRSQYFSLLADRLTWMLEQEPKPTRAALRLSSALEQAGVWAGNDDFESPKEAVRALLVDNPAWADWFSLTVDLPSRSPWQIRVMPAALLAIEETTLDEWIDLATPAIRD